MDIVLGEPLRWGRYTQEGWADIVILDLSNAISRKRCTIGAKLVLITNRKSIFDCYQTRLPWMTLNGVIAPNGRVISPNARAFGVDYVKVVEHIPKLTILSAAEM